MPTKLNKPITIVIHHVENAIVASLKNHNEWDFKGNPRHTNLAHSAQVKELGDQLDAALKEQGIDRHTWEPKKPIKVGEYEAKDNGDGSVQIGCTRVDRETIKAVMKLSDEAVEKEPEWPKWFYRKNSGRHCANLVRLNSDKSTGRYFNSVTGNDWDATDSESADFIKDGFQPIPAAEAESILKK